MKSQGIRIQDKHKESGIGCIDLIDILEEIKDVNVWHWSILFMDAMGDLGDNRSIAEFEDQIRTSAQGIFVSWNELYNLAQKLGQIFWMTIIGCNDVEAICRYEDDEEMYEACDIVIEMIDGGYWEIFSKDEGLIKRLAVSFKKTEFLETDYIR